MVARSPGRGGRARATARSRSSSRRTSRPRRDGGRGREDRRGIAPSYARARPPKATAVRDDALIAAMRARNAVVAELHGDQTAAHFGDPAAEYRALGERAGLVDLPW